MQKIHPTAIIGENVKLGENVEIGPYCVIGDNVEIGNNCKLISQCHIGDHTTIGDNNIFYPFASIGTDPEDYAYDPAQGPSFTKIGNNNKFREGVTVNRGTHAGTTTVIGDGCFFMANSHVAHNCVVGNNVIMVVGSMIAGYVEVGDKALLSGITAVHQFCRVGRMAVISGCSAISMDLPPFMITAGRNEGVSGFNIVGMRRSGFAPDTIRAVKKLYDIFFRQSLSMPNAIAKAEAELPQLPEVVEFIDFIKTAKRGVLPGANRKNRTSSPEA